MSRKTYIVLQDLQFTCYEETKIIETLITYVIPRVSIRNFLKVSID